MAGFGDKPFGLRDIKLTNAAGTTQVDLPSAMKMTFRERLTSGEILPCGLLKLESSVPTPPHYTGSSRYMLVYLYERFGYSSVSTALKRIFDLVHRTSFAISEGDGLWRIDWAGDVLDSWDDALGCSLITSRYVGYIRRG